MADGQNPILRAYRVLRWFILTAVVVLAYLAMKAPARQGPLSDPALQKQQAEAFQEKLKALADAHQQGSSSEVDLQAGEINAAIAESISQPQAEQAGHFRGAALDNSSSQKARAPELRDRQIRDGQSHDGQIPDGQIKDARVEFSDDIVTGYFTTQLYGRELHLTVAGKLGSQDGYVTFHPTSFKVGDLNIPVSMVDPALHKKLALPENRDKLKLPDFVADLRVENGRLIVAER